MLMAYSQKHQVFASEKEERHEHGSTSKRSGTRRPSSRALRVAAVAAGLAAAVGGLAAQPALAAPADPRVVHVEGQLVPMEYSPGSYRVSGGLVGTYQLRSERVIHSWTYFTTQIQEIEGTETIDACVDQNLDQSCQAGEPSADMSLRFSRVASFDTRTGQLIESRCTHWVIRSGPLSGGVLTMRDITMANGEILSTYAGDLQMKDSAGSSVAE